ncbi:MAG: DUF1559 domain-containing protein, partial [Opitutaceae bacterium]|nr:DUF1559 domain-containing protein [Opitutaceae bacterium]
IIGILAAIIIPTVSKVREAAKAAHCKSNLRQIGTAAAMYANDNKDLIVPVMKLGIEGDRRLTSYWTGQLSPYMSYKGNIGDWVLFPSYEIMPVYICPASQVQSTNVDAGTVQSRLFGYGYNYNYLSYEARKVYYNQVSSPAKVVFITDEEDAKYAGRDWKPYVRYPDGGTDYIVSHRHPSATANILWLDGHVTAEKKTGEALKDTTLWKVN